MQNPPHPKKPPHTTNNKPTTHKKPPQNQTPRQTEKAPIYCEARTENLQIKKKNNKTNHKKPAHYSDFLLVHIPFYSLINLLIHLHL